MLNQTPCAGSKQRGFDLYRMHGPFVCWKHLPATTLQKPAAPAQAWSGHPKINYCRYGNYYLCNKSTCKSIWFHFESKTTALQRLRYTWPICAIMLVIFCSWWCIGIICIAVVTIIYFPPAPSALAVLHDHIVQSCRWSPAVGTVWV